MNTVKVLVGAPGPADHTDTRDTLATLARFPSINKSNISKIYKILFRYSGVSIQDIILVNYKSYSLRSWGLKYTKPHPHTLRHTHICPLCRLTTLWNSSSSRRPVRPDTDRHTSRLVAAGPTCVAQVTSWTFRPHSIDLEQLMLPTWSVLLGETLVQELWDVLQTPAEEGETDGVDSQLLWT